MATTYWAVIPAAGAGVRMGGAVPKQYLPLAGRTVLEQTLSVFLSHPGLRGLTVAIAPDDRRWEVLHRSTPALRDVREVEGGATRAHSVLNALASLRDELQEQDWVLVHDAVRPCLHHRDIDRLLGKFGAEEVGGLLACPLSDTLKRADTQDNVTATLAREGLWRAFTPQLFRHGPLLRAVEKAISSGNVPTDEAAAMERAGHRVSVVAGSGDNIKITHPDDLALAEAIIAGRAGGPE